ncbi:hypothetical protein VNO80_13063 [Phaseolus coccineus]|uniref:Uncharacterized protein n=1 Tax=Phaseolus coccineus TaxID=3886 RepID=A0AAN9N0F6_PHACN
MHISRATVAKDEKDTQVWRCDESGSFTVSSAYECLDKFGRGPQISASKYLWKIKAFPKLQISDRRWRQVVGVMRRKRKEEDEVCSEVDLICTLCWKVSSMGRAAGWMKGKANALQEGALICSRSLMSMAMIGAFDGLVMSAAKAGMFFTSKEVLSNLASAVWSGQLKKDCGLVFDLGLRCGTANGSHNEDLLHLALFLLTLEAVHSGPVWRHLERPSVSLPLQIDAGWFAIIDGQDLNVHIANNACLMIFKVTNIIIHDIRVHHCKPQTSRIIMGPKGKVIPLGNVTRMQ